MPAEMILQLDPGSGSGLAEMSDDDKAEGCGYFVGNGDKPGPLWIVDATDFSKLGPANDKKSPEQAFATDSALRKASEDALVATWTNPAGRAGGSLTFSPHNQQIVGDRIYLSHYHGGVYVLDASAAFAEALRGDPVGLTSLYLEAVQTTAETEIRVYEEAAKSPPTKRRKPKTAT